MRVVLLALSLFLLIGLAAPVAAQNGGETTLTATVIVDAVFLRGGPGTDFPVVQTGARDDLLILDGRTEDGSWYRTTLSDGTAAWIASYLVRVDGDPAALAVAEPLTSESAALIVPPGCEYFNVGPYRGRAGQPVWLAQGWEAATRELVEDYLDNVIQVVTFDGRIIGTYAAYASDITYHEDSGTWQIFWEFRMGPISAGAHRLEWTQMYERQITDGLDRNGDGQPDTYGPVTEVHGCTVIIE